MTKRRAAAVPETIEWRGGVHLIGTPLWCDASGARDACFLSAADVVIRGRRPSPGRAGRASPSLGHAQIVCTDLTRRLLPDAGARARALAAPLDRPFALGDLRVELCSAGGRPGGAQVVVDIAGRRVLYAGRVFPRGGGLAGPAAARKADVLVVDATFAAARFRFPPLDEARAAVAAWVDEVIAEDATPIVVVEPLGGALELAGALASHGTVVAHRAIADVARTLAAAGFPAPKLTRLGRKVPRGGILLWPAGTPLTAAARVCDRPRAALASPWAQDPRAVARAKVAAAFPLSLVADREQLEGFLGSVGATEVVTIGASPAVAAELGARPLGQLTLF